METSPSPEAVREAYAFDESLTCDDLDSSYVHIKTLAQHSRALEARVKELEDYAKKYCAPSFEEYIRSLEDENAKLKLLKQAHGVIAKMWEASAITEDQWVAHLAKRERDSMDAGYAQGVEQTERRAVRRIDELEAQLAAMREALEAKNKGDAAIIVALDHCNLSLAKHLIVRRMALTPTEPGT